MSQSKHSEWLPEVADWLAEHPDANRDDLYKTWEASAGGEMEEWRPPQDRVDVLRQSIRSAIDEPVRLRTIRQTPRLRPRLSFRWGMVAAVAGLALLAWLWPRATVYTAPLGESVEVALADGSRVTLNSGSRLEVSSSFGEDRRHLTLDGEAFFGVQGADVPFLVETFNATVEVIGTRFNVRSWGGELESETNVVVEEGSVRLASDAGSVTLSPGEMSRVIGDSRRPSAPTSIELEQSLSWKTGGFLMTNKPLADVAAEMERRLQISVEITPIGDESRRVSLYLRELSAERAFQSIGAALECSHSVAGTNYQLTCGGPINE